jgi:hypothetical protein
MIPLSQEEKLAMTARRDPDTFHPLVSKSDKKGPKKRKAAKSKSKTKKKTKGKQK